MDLTTWNWKFVPRVKRWTELNSSSSSSSNNNNNNNNNNTEKKKKKKKKKKKHGDQKHPRGLDAYRRA